MPSRKKEGKDATLELLERLKAVQGRVRDAPAKQYAKVGLGLLFGGIGFGWIAFPYILDFAVAKMMTLNDGTDVRRVWKRIPQTLDFNVYLFNITNPTEVQNGGVPELQEVGPYYYKEWKEKVNLFDDIQEDTITYNPLNTWYFLKEKSWPLTGEELVTVPHLPLMSSLLVAEQDFPAPMLTVLNAAIPKIHGKLDSVFMTAKVKDLLFDGILIDCRAKEIVPKTVCLAIKLNSKPLVKLGNNRYLFSFFGVRNATPEEIRITVMKGTRNVYDIGKIVALNGRQENFAYPEGECNKLVGTDGTIFPPFRKPDNNSIFAFSSDICRAMSGTYERPGEYQGVSGHKYVVTLGDMKRNLDESCYCNKKCLGKGAIDLTKCAGAPIIVTLPHFYESEEKFLKGVKGLNPQKEKHELTFIMEPTSGVPLMARKRVQFNIELHPIRYVNLTKKLKPTLLPVFWLEENLDLGDELMNFLQANLLTNLRLVDIVKWTLIMLGIGVCVGGVVLHRMRKEAAKKKSNSQESLISQDSNPEILDPSRLSEGLSGASSKIGPIQPRRQVWPESQRVLSGIGWSPPQVQSLWTPKMTPVESLPQGIVANSAPIAIERIKSRNTKSGRSVGKLGLF